MFIPAAELRGIQKNKSSGDVYHSIQIEHSAVLPPIS